MTTLSAAVAASSGSGVYPAPPDRLTLLQARWHFQGLHVPIDGLSGWFEPALAWIDRVKRPQAYAVKDAAGDQLYGISLSGAYTEGGQPYAQYAGYDFSQDLPGLNALIDEIVTGATSAPRYVRLFCAGDGQGAGPGYNDPVGRTYGHDWLMAFTPTLIQSLGDRIRFVQFYPGYDGIFYGWEPAQVTAWGGLMRSLIPADCVVGIEHGSGTIPLGDGNEDYSVNGPMDAYDLISSEYDGQAGGIGPCLVHNDKVWQINGRLRAPGQAYNRPPDQPAWDDPNPPAIMGPNSRGIRIHECMEWATYYDVRGGCESSGIAQDRAYLAAMSPDSLIA